MESKLNQTLEHLSQDFKNLHLKWDAQLSLFSQKYQGVAVASSGGVDSTVLLHLFLAFAKFKKNFNLAICHVNFGLRDKESDYDQEFLFGMSKRFNVPFFSKRVSPQPTAGAPKESTQLWARKLRYQEFHRLAKEGWIIALGHHEDDLAENALLRLARGTSPSQMGGMREWHPPFWRPLLGLSKSNILQIADRHHLRYREDITNAKMDYSRNVVRHKILTVLEDLYPGASRRIARCAREAMDHGEFINTQFAPLLKEAKISGLPRDWFKQQSESIHLQVLSQYLGPLNNNRKALSSRFLKRSLSFITSKAHEKSGKKTVLQIPACNKNLIITKHKVIIEERKKELSKNVSLHKDIRWKECVTISPGQTFLFNETASIHFAAAKLKFTLRNTTNRRLDIVVCHPKPNFTIKFAHSHKHWLWRELLLKNKVSIDQSRGAILFAEILPSSSKRRMVGMGCWVNGFIQNPDKDGLFRRASGLLFEKTPAKKTAPKASLYKESVT